MSVTSWIAVGALALSVAALAVATHAALTVRRLYESHTRHTPAAVTDTPHTGSGIVAVIYNPSKNADFDELRTLLDTSALTAGYTETRWFATTIDEPGAQQARHALTLDPSLIIAAGGDGTVRMVAGEVASSGVPFGIIPVGTGNLLARNLGLPLTDTKHMIDVALTGRARHLDMCWLTAPHITPSERATLPPDITPFEGTTPFLVISGIGFDAKVMADANSNLKHALGWSAYIVSGVQHLNDDKIHAHIHPTADTDIPVEARSVMFANCGELVSGFVLAPHARIDDGWLDVTVMDTKGGIIGWTDLLRRVSLQGIGAAHSPAERVLPEIGTLETHRTRSITVTTDDYEYVEADGDVLGVAREVTAHVDHAALTIHVP